jgi:hypothetical protein
MTKPKLIMLVAATWLLTFSHPCQTRANIINATNVSYEVVSNACAAAQPGDTVKMPPGAATWYAPLWLPLGVSLEGSGTNSTIITDNAILTDNALINAVNTADGSHTSLTPVYLTHISDFQIVGAGNTTFGSESDSVITIGSGVDSQPIQWRISNLFFNQCVSHQIVVWNKLGLIDHCYFLMQSYGGAEAVRVFGDLQTLGNYSWSIPYNYGTTNSLYVEMNTFNCITPNSAGGICDIPQGGGMVFRYNTAINSVWCNHGLEGQRSCRWWEIYNNTFIATNNTFTAYLYAMDFRGGTGIVFSNTIIGFKLAESTENYRSTTYFAMFGGANGLNPLDLISNAVFLAGTWTGDSIVCTNNQLTLPGTNWTTNQWAGYSFVDTTTNALDQYGYPALAFALIISNDNSSLTFYPPKATGGTTMPYLTIQPNDTWEIHKVIRALDQIGSSSGSLLSFVNFHLVGTNDQTNETLYWWSNTLDGATCYFSNNGNPCIVEGRDFTNDVAKPGYDPLGPHPLDVPTATETNTNIISTGTGTNVAPLNFAPLNLQAGPPASQ